MLFALDSQLNRRQHSAVVARNLLDFVYFNYGMCKGVRANPEPPAFGLIAWGDIGAQWLKTGYSDGNARGLLGTAIAGVALNSARWD